MTDCSKCQLWEESCICNKCPNCKSKDYIEIREEIVKHDSGYKDYYKRVSLVYCSECSIVFTIEI